MYVGGHRRYLLLAKGLFFSMVLLSFIMMSMIYSHWQLHFEVEMPVLDAINKIEANVSRAHLLIEEALLGERDKEQSALQTLDEADGLMGQALAHLINLPDEDHAVLTELLISIQDREGHFHQLAIDRLSGIREKALSKQLDEAFDHQYEGIIRLISQARSEMASMTHRTQEQIFYRSGWLSSLWVCLLILVLISYLMARKESRQSWQELLQSEKKKSMILDHAMESIILIDQQGAIIEFNHEAERMFGYHADEVLGKSMVGTLFPDESKVHFATVVAACTGIKAKPAAEYYSDLTLISSDGRGIPVEMHISVADDEAGRNCIVCIRDISDRKASEQEKIREKMELVNLLAGGVAHQINNALVRVQTTAQLLQLKYKQNQDLAHKLDIIASGGQHIGRLVEELLAFSRGGAIHIQFANPNEIIKKCVREFELIPENGALFELRLLDTQWGIRADLQQIEMVFKNVIENAVDAVCEIGRDGRILITTALETVAEHMPERPGIKAGKYYRICVEDNGCGISSETAAHMFEPFFTTKEHGTGTGMAAIFGAIKNHNGYIYLDSDGESGCKACIYLPAILP